MNDILAISKYLSEVLQDWRSTRAEFPRNVYPPSHWPIPFFGNPATAIVATVGVNPSSGEFHADRNWKTTQSTADWKRRLKNYFNHSTPSHEWFNPWRIGLELLDMSYEAGTAAHFDVSYRPTKAMIANRSTDPKEFRAMAVRDVQWLFKLLPMCPNLRLLLTMGPILGNNLKPTSLLGFLCEFAPRHGFKVIEDGGFRKLWQEDTRQVLALHEADTPDEKCITCRVVKNLHTHRDELRRLCKISLEPKPIATIDDE